MRNSNQRALFDGTAAVSLYGKSAGQHRVSQNFNQVQIIDEVPEELNIYPLPAHSEQSRFESRARHFLGNRSYEGLRGNETAFATTKSKVSIFLLFNALFTFGYILEAIL